MIPDYGKGGIMSKRNNKPTKNVNQDIKTEEVVKETIETSPEDISEEVTEEVVETEEVTPEDISEETEEETVEETEEVEETKVNNFKAKVTANKLRLRDAPSTDAVIMNVFSEGTEVTILTENNKNNLGEWEFVSVSMLDGGIKMEGYMMTKFLEVL